MLGPHVGISFFKKYAVHMTFWSMANLILHFHHKKYWTSIFNSVEKCLEWTCDYSLLRKETYWTPFKTQGSVFWTLKGQHFLSGHSRSSGHPPHGPYQTLGPRDLPLLALSWTTTPFAAFPPCPVPAKSPPCTRFADVSDFITWLRSTHTTCET